MQLQEPNMYDMPNQAQIDAILAQAHAERARAMRQGASWVVRTLLSPFRPQAHRRAVQQPFTALAGESPIQIETRKLRVVRLHFQHGGGQRAGLVLAVCLDGVFGPGIDRHQNTAAGERDTGQ